MFHQVRLLPQDKPLLRFLWHDLDCKAPPTVYEWQVLPFGTTSSPCCAIYILQRIIKDAQVNEHITHSIHNCFYVDNCLQSLPTPEKAKDLLHSLHTTLSSGGFEIRQWASNDPQVICDIPPEARSEQTELWLSHHPSLDPSESTLGLLLQTTSDTGTEPLNLPPQLCVIFTEFLLASTILSAISFLTQQEPKLLSSIYGVRHGTGMIKISLIIS